MTYIFDFFGFELPAELVGLIINSLLLAVAVTTLHRDSNTKKLEFFHYIWSDIQKQIDQINAKRGNRAYEVKRFLNSVEYMAMGYNRNLLHRKVCKDYLGSLLKEFLEKPGIRERLEGAKDPEFCDIKLMRKSLDDKGLWKESMELMAPLPIIGSALLYIYNANLGGKLFMFSSKIKKIFGRWIEGLGIGVVSAVVTISLTTEVININSTIFFLIASGLLIVFGAWLQD